MDHQYSTIIKGVTGEGRKAEMKRKGLMDLLRLGPVRKHSGALEFTSKNCIKHFCGPYNGDQYSNDSVIDTSAASLR